VAPVLQTRPQVSGILSETCNSLYLTAASPEWLRVQVWWPETDIWVNIGRKNQAHNGHPGSDNADLLGQSHLDVYSVVLRELGPGQNEPLVLLY
jgi:hypothetical protein